MFCGVSLLLLFCMIMLEIRGAPIRQSSEDYSSSPLTWPYGDSAPSKRGTFFQFDFAELRLGRTDEPPSPGATHPEENIKYKTYNGAVELYFTAGPSTESTEGNKIHSYRSKKMAHRVKPKGHFIESNTFLKSKRKVGSFKDSTAASEGNDQLEKR